MDSKDVGDTCMHMPQEARYPVQVCMLVCATGGAGRNPYTAQQLGLSWVQDHQVSAGLPPAPNRGPAKQ
jgi:hypothetical protein